MSSCDECLYNADGICQNDECSFDLEDNCYEFESKSTYDRGYQRGRADALKEAFDKTYTKAYDSGYQNGRKDAEAEHEAMCESCIHKVSAEDIQAIKDSAIEKCAEIISKNMRCESCPVDCLWGTEQKCKDTLALYLKTQIEEQKNG